MDERSESAWESIMRVLHVAAEIPVEAQVEILDDRGLFIARVDLLIKGTRRIDEYDGEKHREPEVQDNDLVRHRRLLGRRLAAPRLHITPPEARWRRDQRRRGPPARPNMGSSPTWRPGTTS